MSITLIGNGVAPLVSATNPYCHTDPGFITKLSGVGSYLVPKLDILIAARSAATRARQRATWNVRRHDLVGAWPPRGRTNRGRDVPVDLIAPGQSGATASTNSMRFAKVLKFGRMRTNVGVISTTS